MRLLRNDIRNCSCLLAVMLAMPLLTGCWSDGSSAGSPSPQADAGTNRLRFDPLRVGDSLKIDFAGTPTPLPFVQTDIKGDGTIRLEFVGDITAEGKTPGELERSIQAAYVPTYYTHLNVTVTPTARFFYVQGEINPGSGGKQLYTGQTTVTRAIAAAGDFNPFANRRHVQLYRLDGTMKIVNCVKALEDPKLDLPVYPGDKIFVPRRTF